VDGAGTVFVFCEWFITAGDADGEEDADEEEICVYGDGLFRLFSAFLAAL